MIFVLSWTRVYLIKHYNLQILHSWNLMKEAFYWGPLYHPNLPNSCNSSLLLSGSPYCPTLHFFKWQSSISWRGSGEYLFPMLVVLIKMLDFLPSHCIAGSRFSSGSSEGFDNYLFHMPVIWLKLYNFLAIPPAPRTCVLKSLLPFHFFLLSGDLSEGHIYS